MDCFSIKWWCWECDDGDCGVVVLYRFDFWVGWIECVLVLVCLFECDKEMGGYLKYLLENCWRVIEVIGFFKGDLI